MKRLLVNKWTLSALILIGSAVVIWWRGEEPRRKTCDRIDTRPCQCHLNGVCICEPGGRCCESCKHLQRPEVEAEVKQARIKEFAERVSNRPAVQKY